MRSAFSTAGCHGRLWLLGSVPSSSSWSAAFDFKRHSSSATLQYKRPAVRKWDASRPSSSQGVHCAAQAAGLPEGWSSMERRVIKLAVVGDVHSQWDADSEAALASLGADVAIFVGDFGEEDTMLIQRIAGIKLRKAVILGNHDAWYSLTERGRARLARKLAQAHSAALPASNGAGPASGVSPAVARQLELLGVEHVGFGSVHYEELNLSIVGGRPFTKGGRQWSDVAGFYQALYGVGSPAEASQRIAEATAGQPAGVVRVIAAHNGPSGLGAARHDICGVDWLAGEGDHGDPDLEAALQALQERGVTVPLVLFGHMHSALKGGGRRNMAHVDPATSTVFVNCAEVPRIREFRLGAGALAGGGAGASGGSALATPSCSAGNGLPLPLGGCSSSSLYDAQEGNAEQQQQQQQQQSQWGEGKESLPWRTPKRSRRTQGKEGAHPPAANGGTRGTLEHRTNGLGVPAAAACRGSSGSGSSQQGSQQQQQQEQQQGQQQEQQQGQQQEEEETEEDEEETVRGRAHHFVVVEMDKGGVVLSARNVWVGVTAAGAGPGAGQGPAGAGRCFILSQDGLVALQQHNATQGDGGAAGGRVYEVYRAHEGRWEAVHCGSSPGQRLMAAGA